MQKSSHRSNDQRTARTGAKIRIRRPIKLKEGPCKASHKKKGRRQRLQNEKKSTCLPMKNNQEITENCPGDKIDLKETLNASQAKQRTNLFMTDLRDKLNAGVNDLRISRNRRKDFDMRRKLEKSKFPKKKDLEGSSSDLQTQIQSKRAKRCLQINIIMGGSPPCGDSIRSVKDYRAKATTSQKCPVRPENNPQITFSVEDIMGIHMPHNDPLLVEVRIGDCEVTKVLIYTGSLVDLIFRDTLRKMGIDLHDMKPSSRSLIGFNGSSKLMLDTICLSVYACGVTRKIDELIHKFFPKKNKFPKYQLTTPSKIVSVGAYFSDKLQKEIITFLKRHASTFPWKTADMKGIDPTIVAHELNGDPKWLANPVVGKKKNGNWRVCIFGLQPDHDAFSGYNQIDRFVESTTGNELLTFMDAFLGYNQIMMHPDDREKTTFITDRGTYCYKVMPFGLKNAEVYIDNMLVKSLRAADHLEHQHGCFKMLNEYGMKLNLAKCTFSVKSGEFLGYIVTQRGIEANLKQISTILNPLSPKNNKELLYENKKFFWDGKCEEEFTQLKQYLISPYVLSKPEDGDILSLYIAVSATMINIEKLEHKCKVSEDNHEDQEKKEYFRSDKLDQGHKRKQKTALKTSI
ncbi:hypothetical protein N665_0532s0073 [Sinapis alba]|nr:hypothetical protein N665_0532s0073 [Sinapis alba]